MRCALVLALSLASGCASAPTPAQPGASVASLIDAACVNAAYESEYDAASNVGCRLSLDQSLPNPMSGETGCATSQYLVQCLGAVLFTSLDGSPRSPSEPPIPAPSASLNCSGAPASTTPNEAFYCCPCSN